LPGVSSQLGPLLALLGGATAMMALGLADDLWGLDWRWRLGVEFGVAAACVLSQGEDWQLTAFMPFPQLAWICSVLWIVALVNAFNMLDNMDAASAGIAAIACAILVAFVLMPGAHAQPQLFVGGFLTVLCGALLGFLVHNRPPARLFMGDAGSYFVGFCIAGGTLLATYTTYEAGVRHAVLAPLCVMAVPLYDMFTVIRIRVREGRSIFKADRCHFSHRLTDLGMTRSQAVLTLYLTTATCGLGALLLPRVDTVGAYVVLLLIICILLLIHILEMTARRTIQD
jgi:UDP-GlcNAc:undecaprenyl-phosphate GlcNAc-1-phosphate transferase